MKNLIECMYCAKYFASEYYLNRHIIKVHNEYWKDYKRGDLNGNDRNL